MKNLQIDIDHESLHIFFTDDEGEVTESVCYWHLDEVKEDEEVAIVMAKAVRLYYTNPEKLVSILKKFRIK
jgi:hypothetical protein